MARLSRRPAASPHARSRSPRSRHPRSANSNKKNELLSSALEEHRRCCQKQFALGLWPGQAEIVTVAGKPIYRDIVGNADAENMLPMKDTSLIRCFSMSKSFTGAGLLLLAEDGYLDFDDPVAKYIPSFGKSVVVRPKSAHLPWVTANDKAHVQPLQHPITLRHLVTHTSGLGYGPSRMPRTNRLVAFDPSHKPYRSVVLAVDNGEISSLEAFCDAIAAIPLRHQPGARWTYSFGVDVLGRVIEIVSGQRLDKFLHSRVFAPLGMVHTRFFVRPGDAANLCAMYTLLRNTDTDAAGSPFELVREDGALPSESNWIAGTRNAQIVSGGGFLGSMSGGPVSCLRDITLFCNMLCDGGVANSGQRLFRQATMRLLQKDWIGQVAKRPLKGFDNDDACELGWTPVAYIQRKGQSPGAFFFGGRESYWYADPKHKLVLATFTQVYWGCTVPKRYFKESVDDLQTVVMNSIHGPKP